MKTKSSRALVGALLIFSAQLGVQGQPCVPSPDGAVSWWRAEGNAGDFFGTNNGTLAGATFVAGKDGLAFSFDGSGQKVIVPDNDAVKLTNSLTIEGWVYANGPGFILFRGDSRPGFDPYAVSVELTGELQFLISAVSGDVALLRTPNAFPTGQWKHIAASLDGGSGDMKLYVDGALVSQTNTTLRPLRDLDPAYDPGLGIGGHAGSYGYFPFNGKIDELALYNRALSLTEVQSIYNAGSAGKCFSTTNGCITPPLGIVGWWPGENNASDATGGNNGQLLNGATFAAGESGAAFFFDGLNDYMKVPGTPNLDVSNQVTVEFWMKADSSNAMNSYQGLVTSDFYGIEIANGYVLGPLGVSFFLSTDGGASTSSSSYPDTATVNGGGAVVSAGVWHHVAGTYDGTKLQLYIDGQPWGNPNFHTGAISPMLATSFVSIGAEDGRTICPGCVGSRYFNGLIDEATIYNRALTAAEIQSIYNAGSAGKCVSSATNNCAATPPGIVGAWKGDGTAVDSINGNNGVLQNVSFNSGVVGQAFACNQNLPYGTYSGVQIADQPAYALTQSLSIEGWVKPRGDGYVIFFRGDHRPGLDPYVLSMQGNNDLRFQICDQNGNYIGVDATIPYLQWTHVAATLEGNTGSLSLYTNGVLAANTLTAIRPFGDLIPGESPGIGIGNVNDGGNNFPFMGDLDEIALYNRALSPSEIQSIYNAGSAGKCAPSGQVIIIAQPTNQIVTVGNAANFSVQALSSLQLFYQWQFKGTNISDATNTWLTLFNVQPGQGGNYSVLVSNSLGSVTSSNALLTVNPAACVSPLAGLVGWWRAEADASDNLGNNHGAVQNGVGFASGKVGQAFLFNSSNAAVRIPSQPDLNVGLGSGFTVEGWISPSDVTVQYPIAEWNDGAGTWGVHFFTDPTSLGTGPGGLYANVTDTTGAWHQINTVGGLLTNNVFAHVALSYDQVSGVAKMYVNGVIAYSGNIGSFTPRTAYDLYLGSRPPGGADSYTFNGLMDEISLYDRALADSEIAEIYNASVAGKCNVPVAPSIVVQPQSATVPNLSSTTLSVIAAGNAPLNYQWLLNNAVILDATNTSLTLSNVQLSQNGEIYSVIVTNLAGSVTSSNAVLTVVNNTPMVSSIASFHTIPGQPIAPITFTVTDVETPADQLILSAGSSNTNVVSTNNIVLGGSGTNRTVTITTSQTGTTTITIRATDADGATGISSFVITVDQFTQIIDKLPTLSYSALAWGDYDNDGQLDLLVSGTTNNLQSGAITRLYHNDGGVFTNFISFTGLYRSTVAWADYDRDGRLDFFVSGLTTTNQPVARIYHNNGNGTFTDINASFPGCYSGTAAWGDFNNDGAADLFFSGLVTTTNILGGGQSIVTTNIARLYRNEGGTFVDANWNQTLADNRLAAPSLGTAAWGDYDNDGRLDLLLTGSINNGQSGIANIFRNLGNGAFTNAFTSSFASSFYLGGTGAFGDYDNDGWLDLAVNGGASAPVVVYHNNRNGTFTQITQLATGGTPTIAWGDYDNDGDLDLLFANSSTSRLYRNNSNGTFTDAQSSLPASLNGSAAWGDFNNDGKLDLAFTGGGKVTLVRNNNATANTPPAAPSLASFSSTLLLSNSVVLTWPRPLDSQTYSNGLNYNIRVGTNEGGIQIVSPLADPNSGQRRIAATGNVGPTNRAMLINLPKGIYYWSAQAIDTAFAGSSFPGAPFAADATFTITNARPVISDIADQLIAPGTNSPGPSVPFTIGDAETLAANLTITVRSSNTNVVALTNIVVTRGVPSANFPSNCTIRVAARTNGISVITVTVTDAQGAFASDSFTVTAEQFSLVASTMIGVENSSVAWGDFDNDGRLDVVIAGNTNGILRGTPVTSMVPVTRLYRNVGNGSFVTTVPTNFPGVAYGSIAWSDFDNDGKLDLLLSGTTNNQLNANAAITRLYRNKGDGTFTNINAGLPGVIFSAVAWGDYDNDGRADILITGSTNGTAAGVIARIYRNNGDGTFSNAVSFPGIFHSAAAFADLDGDADLDLVMAGLNANGTASTSVYRNNGTNNSFTLVQTSLVSVYDGSIAVGDCDNDGRPDILLAGYNGSYFAYLYRNQGSFSFVSFKVDLIQNIGAGYASAALGDFDNDGKLDVLLSGTSNGDTSGAFTRVFRNTGSFISQGIASFVLAPSALPTNYFGAVGFADFDNDGDLDVLVTGTDGVGIPNSNFMRAQTQLYRNNCNVSNTPPTLPTVLTAVRSNNIVSLKWAKSTDLQTGTMITTPAGKPIGTNYDGIKYQIRVGTSPGGIETESPLADLSNGYRRVVRVGDASTNRWQLLNLPPGTYYWSVQGIDTEFAGSPFATENSFVVSHLPTAIPDFVSTPVNTPTTFSAAKLLVNDINPDGYPLTVVAVSQKGSLGGTATLTSDQIQFLPQSATFSGNDVFTYTITDGVGSFVSGTFTVTVGNGGAIALNIVYGPVVESGDFVVRFAGIPGLTYTVEWSPALDVTWFKARNITVPATDAGFGIGVFEFREPVTGSPTRFYRTVYPAY